MKHLYLFKKVLLCSLFLYAYQAQAQCSFSISTAISADKSCKYAVEDVVWTDLINVTATGNDIAKTSGGNSWNNAGAISKNLVYNNGFMQTVVAEVDKARMIGLNTTSNNQSYAELEYAFYLTSSGDLKVYENGSDKGIKGAYENGDTLRISVLNNEVYYIKNNNVIYMSTVTPTTPLFVDFSIKDSGGTFKKVVIGNSTDSVYKADEANPGTSPSYQWKLNGTNAGTSATYTNNLVDGDKLLCILTLGAGGCKTGSISSNLIHIKSFPIDRDITYGIRNDSVQDNSCFYATENVSWKTLSGVKENGLNNIIKTTNSTDYNGAAFSFNYVKKGGYMQTIVNETNTRRMIGLNDLNQNVDYSDIDFAFYLTSNGYINIFEGGANKGTLGSYLSGDTLRIAVVGNKVRYIRNGNIIYTSTKTPTLPLYVNLSLADVNSTAEQITISNPTYGRFAAKVDGLANVHYQWKLNGGDVGTDSPIYTNTSLTTNDSLYCIFSVNATQFCGLDTSFASNAIKVKDQNPKNNLVFAIRNDSVSDYSCSYAYEEVGWRSINGLTVSGSNNLSKTSGSNNWDAGAFSYNKVEEGGYVQTVVNETNTYRMVGLNAVNQGVSYTDIDYALYLNSNGKISIYENGSYMGNWGGYATGDTLRVAVVGNTVRYIKNGNIIYTSGITPILPLYVDLSIKDVGATLEDIIVNNPAYGRYTALVEGVSSYSFQWQVNGINAGTDTSIFVNDTISDGDTVSCKLTITNTLGCSSDTIAYSNRIVINKQSISDKIIFAIRSDSTTKYSCNFAYEEVGWTSISGVKLIGSNNVVKVGNVTDWDAGGFSYNKVEDGGFMQTIIDENNTARMIGLNSVNQNVSYQDIEYALYLNYNGIVSVYEKGSYKGNWGAYSTGDTMRISVVGNTVRYIKNGNTIYTSATTPTMPLYVDMSLKDVGATLKDITVNNTIYGVYSAYVDGADSVSYQWKLNGLNVGNDSAIYVNALTVPGDTISCNISMINTIGCAPDTIKKSNQIIINKQSILDNVVFSIRSDSSTDYSCKFAFEEVGWQSLSGVQLNGSNNMTKVGTSVGWDAGAFSYNKVDEGGFMQTIVNETNTNRMIGLNDVNTSVAYGDIKYAFYLNTNGTFYIFESGSNKGNWGAYATGDTMRISVVGNSVRYIQNGNIVYTSAVVPTMPLYVDMSLSTVGATLEQIVVNNTTYGRYSAFVDGAADSVSYQWKLNGLDVGTDTSIYVNTSTLVGDILSCELFLINTSGCGLDTIKMSNQIIINEQSLLDNTIFAIRNDSVAYPSCKYAYEEVGWQSLSAVELTGTNNVTKVGSSSGWDAGGFSYNKVEKGGFMQTIVAETGTSRMIGLNSVNTNVSYTDIDYAFYLQSNNSIKIYENGSDKGTWGAYTTGDTLQIVVVGSTVRYMQNGTIIYSSINVPTLPLYVDFSISTVGGTLKDIVVDNATTGYYSAFVDGADSVSYQWKLNSVNVGTDTAVYFNDATNAGDTISCDVILTHTVGCAPDTIKGSNKVIINEQSIIDNVLYSIRNDSLTRYSCLFATEEVAWQTISSLEMNGSNNVEKIGSNTGWDAGAFSFNKVENGGFMQTVVKEKNKSRMIGLNAVNTSISYNDIDYAFYLQSNGNLDIYENGANKGNVGTYKSGDILRVAVLNNEVKYYKNSNLIFTSSSVPNLPLYVDLSVKDVGATLEKITVYNGLYGNFAAFSDGATNVKYTWKLNGSVVGKDSAGYSNLLLSDVDYITSEIAILGATGCGPDTMIYSNRIDITEVPFGDFVSFYIDKDNAAPNGCQYVLVDASWELENGVVTNGNSVSKPTGSNKYDGLAFSINSINNNDFMQFVTPQNTFSMMVGLNDVNTTSSYNDIDFCFYLNRGNLRIYEKGSLKGVFGSYNANDTFRINVVGNKVYYIQNNILLYTSSKTPSLPLHIDMSLYDVGSEVKDFVIGSATNGKFIAITENAGYLPNYQWKLNGVNTGLDTNVYENYILKPNDVITCVLTPDYGHCTISTIESNSIQLMGDNPPRGLEPIFTPTNTTWLGNNTNWYDASNWTNGTPHAGYNAIVPGSRVNYPTITDKVILYGLNISSGATVNMTASSNLKLCGDVVNNGSFNPANARVEINRCNAIVNWSSTSVVTIQDLVMNNPKGLRVINGNIRITDSLTFKEGIIDNGDNQIIFRNNAKWGFANDSAYVAGAVEKFGNQAFEFPVGDSNQLRTIAISAPNGVGHAFKARYYYQDPNDVPYSRSALGSGLDHVSACEYWTLDRTNANSNVNVTIGWNANSCGVTKVSDIRVARWDGNQWEDRGHGAISGNLIEGTIRTATAVSSFSPFTLASSTADNPLPITLLDFRARLNNKVVNLEWETTSEINNDYFSLEKSKEGKDWTVFAKIDGAGNSNSLKEYSDKDYNPYKGISYYRLKQTDFNGEFEYSAPVSVVYTDQQINIYPNPIKDWIYIDNLDFPAQIKVYSVDGKLIYSGNEKKINASEWAKGVYELKILDLNGKDVEHYKLVK